MKTIRVEHLSKQFKGRMALQDILILDEPMNGLDKEGVAHMRELFLKMKEEGKTLLFASHNREDIEMLCDEVYEMDGGRLIRIDEKSQNYGIAVLALPIAVFSVPKTSS